MIEIKRRAKSLLISAAPRLWVRWHELRRAKSSELELRYIPHLFPHGGTTVDVGANLGLYTRRLAKISRLVYAFEPLAEMSTLVERTTGSNVVVRRVGLSDRSGSAEIRVPKAAGRLEFGLASLQAAPSSASYESRHIPLSTLDAEVRDRVCFVKIDVEGHEVEVLNGAARVIEESRPVLLVESEERHREGAPRAVFRFLAERGYEGFFIAGREVMSVADLDLKRHQDPSALADKGGRKPGMLYINNFLFFPAEQEGRTVLERTISIVGAYSD